MIQFIPLIILLGLMIIIPLYVLFKISGDPDYDT